MKSWFVLYVNVRHEKKVMQRLLEKGIEAYVPLSRKLKQWSDRKKWVEEPLFTGYVFVKVSVAGMDAARFVPGVLNYLSFKSGPAVVREEEIEGLKFFIERGYLLEEEECIVHAGDKVILNLGEFRNFRAEIDEVVNEKFVYVIFEGVKKNIRVKAPVASLKTERK